MSTTNNNCLENKINKKNLGQFFTPENVAGFMVELASINLDGRILEPSSGKGVFIKVLFDKGYENISGYEVDNALIQDYSEYISNTSFISSNIDEKFDLVIGNPPYIRWKNLCDQQKDELNVNKLWKKYFNSLCDYLYIFILKSVELLNEGGELIFITPEYWISTTHAQTLRDYLVKNGYFTHIIKFIETIIFDGVASSTIIFKYKKTKNVYDRKIKIVKYNSQKKLEQEVLDIIFLGKPDPRIEVFYKDQFKTGKKWILAKDETEDHLRKYEVLCKSSHELLDGEFSTPITLKDIADIGNGMVSGLDKVFQIPPDMKLSILEEIASINVVKAKNIKKYYYSEIDRYLFLNGKVATEDNLIKNYPNFYSLLIPFRKELENRYNYKKQINYWEWAFPRNLSLFSLPSPRIFVPCKERISHKKYFRFAFASEKLFPTQDVTGIVLKPHVKESIFYILAILNSDIVFEWMSTKGIIKGNIIEFSEKPLASIPIRLIDWKNTDDINIHEEISSLCKKFISTKKETILNELNLKVRKII